MTHYPYWPPSPGGYPPPNGPPFVIQMPQNRSELKEFIRTMKTLEGLREHEHKKEKEKKDKEQHKGHKWSVLEVTILLVLFSPFISVAYLKLLKMAMTSLPTW